MKALLCMAIVLAGTEARADTSARVLALRGAAYLDTGSAQIELFRGMAVDPPVTIVTEADSAIRLRLEDGSIVKLGASTRMTLDRFDLDQKRKRRASFKLSVGRLWAKVTDWVGGKTNYEVETTNAVVGIRGTEFVLSFDDSGVSKVLVVDGTVEMQDSAQEFTERVGPFFAGLFSGEGKIEVRELDLDELKFAAADVHIGPQLTNEELQSLAKRKRRRGDVDEVRPLPFGLWPDNGPIPESLPQEPGVGEARSFGRLEVRDD